MSLAKSSNKLFNTALFIENIKRFWLIDAAAFVIYFMTGPFMLLDMKRTNGYYVSVAFVQDLLHNHNWGVLMMEVVLPVVCAAAVFNYLFSNNAAISVHSQPYSRSDLFVTNCISGMALSMIPGILNTAVLFILKEPTHYPMNAAVDVFTTSDIMLSLLYQFVIISFIFGICVLSCMISGTAVINILTCCALNVLVPVMYICLSMYTEVFVWGFSGSFDYISDLELLHPIISVSLGSVGIRGIIVYLVISYAVLLLAYVAYITRPMEKTGESYTRDWIKLVISILIGFLGSSFFGLIFYGDYGYLGFIVGGLLCFVLGLMIIRKTFRIADKSTFRSVCIFAVIMAAIIASYSLDLFNLSGYMPGEDDICSASISSGLFYQNVPGDIGRDIFTFENQSDIVNVRELHKELISKKIDYKDRSFCADISITYKIKNGKIVRRMYSIPYREFAESRLIERLVNSETGVTNLTRIDNWYMPRLSVILDGWYYDTNGRSSEIKSVNLSSDEKEALLNAWIDDTQSLDYKYRAYERAAMFEGSDIPYDAKAQALFDARDAAYLKYGDMYFDLRLIYSEEDDMNESWAIFVDAEHPKTLELMVGFVEAGKVDIDLSGMESDIPAGF